MKLDEILLEFGNSRGKGAAHYMGTPAKRTKRSPTVRRQQDLEKNKYSKDTGGSESNYKK